MSSDRSVIEREMQRLELRPFSLDAFHGRRERRQRNRRIRAGVLALVVAVAGAGVLVPALSRSVTPGDPRGPFLGEWVTTDIDGGTPTMTIRATAEGAAEVVVRDDVSSVCSGASSTMTGTGRLDAAGGLVIPTPVLTCDDGSEPRAASGGPLLEQLRNTTFVHDIDTDTLTDTLGLVWTRVGAGDPEPERTPTEAGAILRGAGEVLLFTGSAGEARGDLVAVVPETREQRVLVEDVQDLYNARWSADGRWVAFEMSGSLWVVDGALEPRRVFDGARLWAWSSTGAQLAVIRELTLFVVDPPSGRVTELASIVGDVTSAPVWTPDGAGIVFGARGGSIHMVDARTGARSLLVQVPGRDLDSVDGIAWSPDGSRLAVYQDLDPGNGRLVVLNANGSGVVVLAEDEFVHGLHWSPDGTRLAFTTDHGAELGVFVAPADGSTRSLVASLAEGPSIPVWSPDGSQIALGHQLAFASDDDHDLVINADGSGEPAPFDDFTYESWRGGSFDCACNFFG